METSEWIITTPSEGSPSSGLVDNIINITATPHTGRRIREGRIKITDKQGNLNEYCVVYQSPIDEFLTVDIPEQIEIVTDGITISITGKSNSPRLHFFWYIPEGCKEAEWDDEGDTSANGIDYPSAIIPSLYKVNNKVVANNHIIPGDPGAKSAYDFSIDITFPPNDSISDIYRVLVIEADNKQQIKILTKQTAIQACFNGGFWDNIRAWLNDVGWVN